MKELIGDYTLFLEKLERELSAIKVDLTQNFCDHLCYRVENLTQYEEMKEKLKTHARLLTEELVNGRPIASFKLHTPLKYKNRQIPLIELPAPKPNSTHTRGLEHAEFVIHESFEDFMLRHQHVHFLTKGMAKTFNPELEIEFKDCAIKLHHMPLESVIAVEQNKIPPEFCDLEKTVPNLLYNRDYFDSKNFVGEKIHGYDKPIAVLTKKAAEALKLAGQELEKHNLGFLVFDAYRPQRAVNHFYEWAKGGLDHEFDPTYHPRIPKSVLFEKGYLAKRSSHSRGSTIDLTLYNLQTKTPLDMGTIFDFFDELSHTENTHISEIAKTNRKFFVDVMKKFGFRNYRQEWWHFTLNGEPFPSTYFDFSINEFWPY